MEIALIVIIVVVVVIGIIKLIDLRKTPEELVKYSYISKKQIMTNAEKSFYDKLLETVGDNHYIVPQAHLSMFMDHKIKGQHWQAAFNVINGKSVDFLLVEKTSQKPVLAIELDDYTHARPERIKRDRIVNLIFDKANIPLKRYNSSDTLNVYEIKMELAHESNSL